MKRLEEEFVFLQESMRIGYDNFMMMPCGRRKRLIDWKVERDKESKARQDAMARRK